MKLRLAFLVPAACALLAGCTDPIDHDDGRWFVTHHGEETDYEMRDEVLFQIDSAEVSDRAYDLIAAIADDARGRPRAAIEVDGYTDTSGTHAHNMALSQARAERVADILVRHGIDRRRITPRGFGESHLAIETPNNVREPRNRRVVIRILPR